MNGLLHRLDPPDEPWWKRFWGLANSLHMEGERDGSMMAPDQADPRAYGEMALDFAPVVGDVKAATYDAPKAFREGHPILGAIAAASALPLAGMPFDAARSAMKRVDDLPMDQASRMARARDMGFDVDTPLYHGTSETFDAFDPGRVGMASGNEGHIGRGIYLSDDAREAGTYARGEGANIIPAYVRGEGFDLSSGPYPASQDNLNVYRNLRDLGIDDPHVREVNKRLDEVDGRVFVTPNERPNVIGEVLPYEAYYHPDMTPGDYRRAQDIVQNKPYNEWTAADEALVEKWNDAESVFIYDPAEAPGAFVRDAYTLPAFIVEEVGRKKVADAAQRAGYTHIREGTERAVFDPKDIRSRHARFDPAQSDSPDLMAGLVGLLGTGALLRANREERR